MTTKNDARLSEFVGETIGVQTWEMLETAVFNEVSMWERLFWQVHFALFPLRKPIIIKWKEFLQIFEYVHFLKENKPTTRRKCLSRLMMFLPRARRRKGESGTDQYCPDAHSDTRTNRRAIQRRGTGPDKTLQLEA